MLLRHFIEEYYIEIDKEDPDLKDIIDVLQHYSNLIEDINMFWVPFIH